MPAQADNINFIPESIAKERRSTKTKSAGTRASLILAVVVALVAAAIFGYNFTVNRKISGYISETQKKTQEIESLKKFGEEGYKLGTRLKNVQNVFDTRMYGSVILKELESRLPVDVAISEITFNKSRGMMLKSSAKASYVPIDTFKTNLLRSSDQGVKSVFTDVYLSDAVYDKTDGIIKFTLDVTIDEKAVADIFNVGNGTEQ